MLNGEIVLLYLGSDLVVRIIYIWAAELNLMCNIFYSAFTPEATTDIVSPGLVEDGIKCGSGKLCYEQRCVTVSSLSLPQCPTDSSGAVCSGNGVRMNIQTRGHTHTCISK